MAVNVLLKSSKHWKWQVAKGKSKEMRWSVWEPALLPEIQAWFSERNITSYRIKKHKLIIDPVTKVRHPAPKNYLSLDFGFEDEALLFKLTWG